MSLFGRKLIRDIGQSWAQLFAVTLMAALSVLIFSGLEGAWRGVQTELDSFATTQRMPDAWVSGFGLTEEDVAAIRDLDGVEHASLTNAAHVTRTDSVPEDFLTLYVGDDQEINAALVVSGGPVSDKPGLWLDDSYARANNITPGDMITVAHGGIESTLSINGLILLSDKIAFTGAGLVAPDVDAFGYGIITQRTADRLLGEERTEQSITVLGTTETVRADAPEILGERYGTFFDRETHPHVATAYERIAQIRSLSYLFSALFLLVALMSIFTSIRRLTEVQRTEIATLKALGYSNNLIGAYFTGVGLIAVITGVLAGLGFTPALSRYVLSTQQGSFSLPQWAPSYTWASVALPVLLLTACALGSWSATRPIRKASPVEGMRPSLGQSRRTVLERIKPVWRYVPFGSRWAIRDVSGNPLRALMGIVATAGCMMLLFTGFGMPDTLQQQIQQSFTEQYRYDTRLTLSPNVTPADRVEIENDTGPGQWIQQGAVRLDTETGADSDAESTLTVLGDGELFRLVGPAGRIDPTYDGAVITERLSRGLDVDIGDTIAILQPNGDAYRFPVTAVTTVSEPQGVFLSVSTWETAGGTFTPTSYLAANSVSAATRGEPGITGLLRLADQRSNAESLVDSLTSVFTLIKVFATLLAVVVLYNLGALSFTERVRDYATLRVLGFQHGELRSLASRENVATTLAGWLIGIPAGWWFLTQYVRLFSTDRASYLPSISASSVIISSTITVFFALSATMLLTRRIKRIDMTSALKGVE